MDIDTSPEQVTIVEVGPRDGLQREEVPVSTADKIALINDLAETGLTRIQVSSFVHPKLVPQMADAEDVCAGIDRKPGVIYSGLALNLRGVERAHAAGLQAIDMSVSASHDHSLRNANRTIDQALEEFKEMVGFAQRNDMRVRAGIQCVFGFERPDDVDPDVVLDIARQHLALGADELALADSSGLADPQQMATMMDAVLELAGDVPVVLHLHDTRGMGLANLMAALQSGVRMFDTAFGGLGGCPFIDGAAGNIATEDSVHMLHRMGFETGIDAVQLAAISRRFESLLNKTALPSKMYALLAPETDHETVGS